MIRERRGCRGKVQRAMLSKLIRKHLQANMKQNKNIIVWILFWRSLGARIHCRMLGLALVPRYFPAFSHFPWQECKGQCSKSPPVAGACSLGLSENRIIFKMRRGCGANGNGLASTVETWSSLFACLFGACLHWYFMHRLAQEVLIFLGDTRSSQCFPRVVLFFVVFFWGVGICNKPSAQWFLNAALGCPLRKWTRKCGHHGKAMDHHERLTNIRYANALMLYARSLPISVEMIDTLSFFFEFQQFSLTI